MKKLIILSAIFVLISFRVSFGLPLESIEIQTGYLNADLDEKEDYEVIPLFISFDYDAKPLLEKIGWKPRGRCNLIFEPFINTVINPQANIEVGSNFLIKYAFPLSKRLEPYFKGGLGILYMSQHTREQGSQYNFLPQAGMGVHIFLRENLAINLEYRYRHLSNNDLDEPNGGIESFIYLTGISFFF